jgi:hypothetical protein
MSQPLAPADRSAGSSGENVEWRLADFIDAIAAEVDRAQDTLALKSKVRGLSVSLKGLALDVAVDARMDSVGQLFFRTVEAGRASSTVLKLDFEEILQGQVEEIVAPVEPGGLPLETLPGITAAEIETLRGFSIRTVEVLQSFVRTPGDLVELSRKGGIPEAHLRRWLGLPFLSGIVPATAPPGAQVAIEGGNLGAQDPGDAVYFQSTAAEILSWSGSRIVVRVPPGAVSGAVYARLDGALSNVLRWEAVPRVEPVRLLAIAPAAAAAGTSPAVVLTGSGFRAGAAVAFTPPIRVRQVTVDSATRITAAIEVPAGAPPGGYDVTVSLPEGTDTLRGTLTVTAPPPAGDFLIASVVPDRGTAGTTVATVVKGTGFQRGLAVTADPPIVVAKVRYVAATRLDVSFGLPAEARGPYKFRFTNPGDQVAEATVVVLPPATAAPRRALLSTPKKR